MATVVFVPGIMGSTMVDDQQRIIWPPGHLSDPMPVEEAVRLLMSPATRPGEVIDTAPCVGDVYRPVLAALRARAGTTVPFAYDWRQDVRTAAAALAARLREAAADGPVALVAHSMGGLVVRWLLECGAYDGEPWFARVRVAVLISTPHLGAPLALFRILGLDGIPIVLPPWSFRLLSADPAAYPSGYQLLPAPDIDCVNRPQTTSIDVYEAFPGLHPAGVAAARALYDGLDRFARPAGVTYFAAYGINHPNTVGTVGLAGVRPAEQLADGDGTVPAWSGNPAGLVPAAAKAFSEIAPYIADHVGIMGNARLLAQLTLWLDRTMLDGPSV